MFLCSHGEISGWDGSGKFKTTRRKRTNQKNSRKQEGKNGERRRRDLLCIWRFTYFVCSPSVWNTLGLPPSCDPTSGEPTLMGTSPTTLHLSIIPFYFVGQILKCT